MELLLLIFMHKSEIVSCYMGRVRCQLLFAVNVNKNIPYMQLLDFLCFGCKIMRNETSTDMCLAGMEK